MFNSSIFWSYYNKASVDKSHTLGEGYLRDNPEVWMGEIDDNNVEEETLNKDDILILGSLTKISHGPRRKRSNSDYKVYDLPENRRIEEEKQQLDRFRDFLGQWPVKRESVKEETVPKEDKFKEVYDEHYRKFYEEQTKSFQTFSLPVCSHSCGGADPDLTPCCDQVEETSLTLGPYVQPSLIENWVTGALEFSANNPLIFSGVKIIFITGIFSLMVILWGVVGQSLGIIPDAAAASARHFPPHLPDEFDEDLKIVVDVVDDNWLTTLENHVRKSEEHSRFIHYYCCVFTPHNQDVSRLECFPHTTKLIFSQPDFTCDSKHKYDISLNSKHYSPRKQILLKT